MILQISAWEILTTFNGFLFIVNIIAWKSSMDFLQNVAWKIMKVKDIILKRFLGEEDEPLTLGTGSGGLGAGLAAEGGGHDLWGQVEEVPQVLDALIGHIPVEMAPSKLLFDVPAWLQRL